MKCAWTNDRRPWSDELLRGAEERGISAGGIERRLNETGLRAWLETAMSPAHKGALVPRRKRRSRLAAGAAPAATEIFGCRLDPRGPNSRSPSPAHEGECVRAKRGWPHTMSGTAPQTIVRFSVLLDQSASLHSPFLQDTRAIQG